MYWGLLHNWQGGDIYVTDVSRRLWRGRHVREGSSKRLRNVCCGCYVSKGSLPKKLVTYISPNHFMKQAYLRYSLGIREATRLLKRQINNISSEKLFEKLIYRVKIKNSHDENRRKSISRLILYFVGKRYLSRLWSSGYSIDLKVHELKSKTETKKI